MMGCAARGPADLKRGGLIWPVRLLLAALLLVLPVARGMAGELHPARIFSDGMVLQRDSGASVFGTATPGSKITVTFSRQKREATAGQDGRWQVKLKSLKASSTPQELVISGDGQSVTVKDVLVGDVWLCSGQDNMQWSVKNSADGQNEINAASYPEIRLFNVSNAPDATPAGRQVRTKGEWKVCSPESVPFFSAVAYYFGREINQTLKVPVGLIETSWGGTGCASWMPEEALSGKEEFAGQRRLLSEALSAPNRNAGVSDQEKRWRAFTDRFTSDESGKARALPAYNDTSWPETTVPATYAQLTGAGEDFDGEVWFRRQVRLPASFIGKDLTLSLGSIDDNDITWFNGQKIGETGLTVPNYWNRERKYAIPAALTGQMENTLAVRVFDQYATGGFTGKAEDIYLQCGNERMMIGGSWRYEVGLRYPGDAHKPLMSDLSPENPGTPTALFNTRIFPLIPLGLKGVIWYQGEADIEQAGGYRLAFQELIRSWRRLWDGDLPFLFVQLANYRETGSALRKDGWPQLREAQLQNLRQSKTGMAVTIDIGQADSLQPPNKQEVGHRLAQAALKVVYEKGAVSSGPLYSGMEIKGGRMRLNFSQTAGGLTAKDGELRCFTIAGRDRVFQPAWAQIEGEQVVVYSTAVADPAAVRYAWSDNPERCNLYNKVGLPASPFRTDDWPLPTLPMIPLPEPPAPPAGETTVIIERSVPSRRGIEVIVVPGGPGAPPPPFAPRPPFPGR